MNTLISRAAQDKIGDYVDGVLRLDETEMWVLKSLHGFDFASVLKTKRSRELEKSKENQAIIKSSIRAKQGALTTMSNRYSDMAEKDSSEIAMTAIEKKMNAVGREIEKLKLTSDKHDSTIGQIERSNNQAGNFFTSLKEVKTKLYHNDHRALFNTQLKRQVESIQVAIYGVKWDKEHYDKQFTELCQSVGAKVITTEAFENLNEKSFENDPLFLLYWFQQLAHTLLVKQSNLTRKMNTVPEEITDAIEGEKFFLRHPSENRSNVFIKIKFKNTIHSVWAKPHWVEKRGGRGLLLAAQSRILHTLYSNDLRRVTFGDTSFKNETESLSFDYPDPDYFPYYPKEEQQNMMETYADEIKTK